jgi:hypothetical protein
MHLDPVVLRTISLVVIFLVVFGSRFTKGSVTQTPEGLVFGIKPIIAWTRIVILPALILLVVYFWTTGKQPLPWWLPVLFFAAIIFIIVQMPGTITLTPAAVTQRFWFQPSKTIQYNEVMAIQAMQGGRMTRILGDNRVKITHTSNHCAAVEFQHEIERRTGKRVIA